MISLMTYCTLQIDKLLLTKKHKINQDVDFTFLEEPFHLESIKIQFHTNKGGP